MIQFKEFKKIKLNPFRKVKWKPKSAETVALIFLCAGVFGAAFFAGGRVMGGHDKKIAQMFRGEKVLVAEDQKDGNTADSEENISLEGKRVSETMSGAADSVKNSVRRAKTQRIARQRAANIARIRSGPAPTGPTRGLSDGRRVCDPKNDHPQGGGKLHVDEDCCPDPNEYPNPRCYYTPQQFSRMQKPPQ